MSTTRDTPTVECDHPSCSTIGKRWEFQSGYCSTRCVVKDKGREQLASLIYDHTRCFSCFRRLKTINPPKPDFEFTERGHGWTRDEDGSTTLQFYDQEVTRQAAVGFQFPTQHSGKGEKQLDDRVITGTICDACGNTDHTHHDPVLTDRQAIGRLVSLLADKDDVAFDRETLHREYESTDDLELAVGKALSDD